MNQPGLNPPVLPPDLEGAMDEMIRVQMFNDNSINMTLAYANMRKCDLYWNGRQWLTPVMDNSGNITDWAELPPYGTDPRLATMMTGTTATQGRYALQENWTQGDGNKFVAVLGAKSPNPRCEALNDKDPDSEALAKVANQILAALRKLWPVEEIHKQICLHAWKDGTYFLYTPHEQSAEKYGYVVRPQEVVEPITVIHWQCPQCLAAQSQASQVEPPVCPQCQQPMVPMQESTENVISIRESREPGMAPGLYAASLYEVTLPFFLKVMQFKESPWFVYQDEPHRGTLLEMYPRFMDVINGNVDTVENLNDTVSQIGQYTRNMRSNVNRDMRQPSRYQWMRTIVWMRPSQYWMFGNKSFSQNGQDIRYRDWLRAQYPTGCRVTRIGRHIVDIQPEGYADHWSIGTPMVSAKVYCDPICWPFLQFQDAINSADNLYLENMERNIPMTLVNRNLINISAISGRQGIPGEMVPVDMESGSDLSTAMYNLPTAKLDGQNFGFRDQMLQSGREITGVQRAIFGAGNASTAHEAELQKTQAMMQLGLAWSNMRDCWKGAYTNALKMLGRYGADVLRKFGLSEQAIEMAGRLVDGEGNLNGVHVIVDEGIPATWGQIHDTITFMLQQNPQAQQVVGIGSPANAAMLQNALGLSDWNVPGSEAKNYVRKLIQRLLEGQVQQPQLDPMTGMPVVDPMTGAPTPPQPSEMINAMILPPPVGIPLFQEWFMSDDGMEAQQKNPAGFENLMTAVMIWATPPPGPGPEQEGGGEEQSEPGGGSAPGPGGPTVGPLGGRGEAPAMQPGNVINMGKR